MSALPASVRMTTERSAPPRELEIRPKQVKAWIEALPLAQSVESARRMSAHLTSLNRAKLDIDVRVQILDVYRPFAAVVLEELEAIYAKAALPLGPRAREALTLARAITFDLAAGYRIAIGEKAGKLITFGAKKQLPLLAARAMEYLGIELIASYKSYSPVPSAIWSEMHQLYLFAERQGMATEPGDAESKATVADLYSEALLLALTDPYRLIPGECDQILALLKPLRGLTTLGQVRPQTRGGGHFLVPCDTDKPPKPMLSANDDAGGPNWRLFDTNAIVDKLRARKSAHETGNVSATLSKSVTADGLALMGELITLWGDPPKRAHRRDPMETTVAVCVGLKAVGHFLSSQPAHDPTAEGEAIRAGITIPLTAVPDDETSKAFPVHEWDVVNHSAGGVKLRRASQSLNPVVVGDAVGIKFINRADWTIGVVRWITQFEEGGMEFGVQFLANTARSVWVQPQNSANPQAKPGLLLTDNEGADSLLTPPGVFGEMRTFEIEAQGEISMVRATSLIEKTPRFDVFYVTAC